MEDQSEIDDEVRKTCLDQAGLWSRMAKEAKTPSEREYCEKKKDYYWQIYSTGKVPNVPRETP